MTFYVDPAANQAPGGDRRLVLAPADVTAGQGLTYESGESRGTLSVTEDVVRGNAGGPDGTSVIVLENGQWTIDFDALGGAGAMMGTLSGGNIADRSVTFDKLPAVTPGYLVSGDTNSTLRETPPDSSLRVDTTANTVGLNYRLASSAAVADPVTLADFQGRTFLYVYEP